MILTHDDSRRRRRALRLRRVLLALTATTGVTVGFLPSTASGDPASPNSSPTDKLQLHTGTVTLITGDQVTLREGVAEPVITPAPGRDNYAFRVSRNAGRLQVIPSDAARLVSTGRLDPRLFDITTLFEYGYDDARRRELPLIVQYKSGDPKKDLAGAKAQRWLPAIKGQVVAQSRKGATTYWDALTRGSSPLTRTLDSDVAAVWLNGKHQVALDRSVQQIGAPSAWEKGLTGQQVTIAVVDSGIDTTHPDLAGKVTNAANFTDEEAGDLNGHGTHVASIAGGTGAGAAGTYKGVAPDVRLLDAKACGADGSCQESDLLAAIQWAAADQKAPIVNLSVGAPDAPGLDLMEQAINTMTAQHGTLFVVAAGNNGPDPAGINSPGSADAALTVGAVDRDDTVAAFSSRGPRTGDSGLKPDITAPGVDIMAARAAGTGDEEFRSSNQSTDQYIAKRGTSMAAPHVSGAAALLLQQHPDWKADRLKAALMASAKPTAGVSAFDQGAGRVDAGRAVQQTVTVSPPGLSFGLAAWPHDDDALLTQKATYHNAGSAPVSMRLAVHAVDGTGAPAPEALFRVSPSELVIPAGGTAEAVVTADTKTSEVPVGRYSGQLAAVADGTTVSTPLSVEKEDERYNVTLTHISRDGETAGEYVTYVDQMGACTVNPACYVQASGSASTTTLRLPVGDYSLGSYSFVPGEEGTTLLMQPVLTVDRDTSVTLDARTAKPVDLTAPEPSARLFQHHVATVRNAGRPQSEIMFSIGGDQPGPLFTGHQGDATADPDAFLSKVAGVFADPGPGEDFMDSPYEYNVADYRFGTMHDGIELHPSRDEFAKVKTTVAATTTEDRTVRLTSGVQTDTGRVAPAMVFKRLQSSHVPFERSRYFLARANLRWTTLAEQLRTGPSCSYYCVDFMQEDFDDSKLYEPGRTYEDMWFGGVLGPRFAAPRIATNGLATHGVIRRGDRFDAALSLFADSTPGHLHDYRAPAGAARLYRDGVLIADSPHRNALWAVQLPQEESKYRLESVAQAPYSDVSTKVAATWTFRSSHVTGTAHLPVMAVRLTPALDDRNHAPADDAYPVPIAVERQPGAPNADISTLTVEASHDDGATWQEAAVQQQQEKWTAFVDNQSGKPVSLRIKAADSDGNGVEQTIIRAYLVKP